MTQEKYLQFCSVQKMVQIDWESNLFSKEYKYTDENQMWCLEDEVNPELAAGIWCDQFEEVKHNTVFVIFGTGSCEYVVELCNRYPENIVIFFEPYDENILRLMDDDVLEKITNPEYLVFIAGQNCLYNLEYTLYMVLRYENLPYIKYACMPNYKKIWEDEYNEFYSICKYVNEKMIMDRNTTIMNEIDMGKNYLYHVERALDESDLYSLCEKTGKSEAIKHPAVLVAAGPSLDKNVDVLKKYKNKAFILCVDAALNTLHRHGIIPDLVVSVDPRIGELKAFNDELYNNLPVVTVMTGSYKFFMNHKGRIFYEWETDAFTKKIMNLQPEQYIALESGGSVANNAFSLLRKMGFETIILVGQDLAYPNGRLHAEGAFENEGKASEEDDKYFYVEDIYGGKVLTEANMNMYREWFEKRIENYKNLNVIDATEGGALIRGTQIMTLQEALERNCLQEEFDFEELIRNVEYNDRLDEKAKLKGMLDAARLNIINVQNRLRKARHLYEKLDKLNRSSKYATKEFKKCISDIKEFTDYMDQTAEIQLLVRFVQKASYEMRETIERDEENTYSEINKIVSSGMKMIDAYIEAGDKLESVWKFVDELKAQNNKHTL